MIELTAEQRRVLQETPPRVLDPQTKIAYVLVKEDLYRRFRSVFGDDDTANVEDLYPLLADIAPEDWEDASSYEDKP